MHKTIIYNYIITQCMNKIKASRSSGTKVLGVPGMKGIKML